jgi:hypothetical protein
MSASLNASTMYPDGQLNQSASITPRKSPCAVPLQQFCIPECVPESLSGRLISEFSLANPLKILVPGERFELPTNGLQNRCSTAELTRRCKA